MYFMYGIKIRKIKKNLKKLRCNFWYNFNYNNNSSNFKPSSDWRKGEIKTIFDGEDNNNCSNDQNYNNYNQNSNNYH